MAMLNNQMVEFMLDVLIHRGKNTSNRTGGHMAMGHIKPWYPGRVHP